MKKIPKRFLDGKVTLSHSGVVPLYGTGLLFLLVRRPDILGPELLRQVLGEEFKPLQGLHPYEAFVPSECEAYMSGEGKAYFARPNNVAVVLTPYQFQGCTGAEISAGTLAHECWHAASFILSQVGVTTAFGNDEPMAYLLDWLVNDAAAWLNGLGFELCAAKARG